MKGIGSIQQAKQRNQEKKDLILSFLSSEGYTHLPNLQLLLPIYPSHLYRFLKKLETEQLIVKQDLIFDTVKFTLWGITEAGLGQAPCERNAPPAVEAFEPSKVKFTTLTHKLTNQKVNLMLSKQGWRDWQNADRQVFKDTFRVEHRPDALITAPNHNVVAIETELTLKPARRYRSIMKSHILATKKGYWSYVFFVVPDDNFRNHLNKRLDKVEYIPFEESRQPFDTFRHGLIDIFTLDELANINTH